MSDNHTAGRRTRGDSLGSSDSVYAHPKMSPCEYCGKNFFPWSMVTHKRRCMGRHTSSFSELDAESSDEDGEGVEVTSHGLKDARPIPILPVEEEPWSNRFSHIKNADRRASYEAAYSNRKQNLMGVAFDPANFDEERAYQSVYDAFENDEASRELNEKTRRLSVSSDHRPRNVNRFDASSVSSRTTQSSSGTKSLSQQAREEREKAEHLRQEREYQLLDERSRLQAEIDRINEELRLIRSGRPKSIQAAMTRSPPSAHKPLVKSSPKPPPPRPFRSRFDDRIPGFNPKSIDPSNATSPDNPLATSIYQIMPRPPIVRRAGN